MQIVKIRFFNLILSYDEEKNSEKKSNSNRQINSFCGLVVSFFFPFAYAFVLISHKEIQVNVDIAHQFFSIFWLDFCLKKSPFKYKFMYFTIDIT